MVSGVGPIKIKPLCSTLSAKSAFSDKNPYPGWIAVASVISAALIIAGMFNFQPRELFAVENAEVRKNVKVDFGKNA